MTEAAARCETMPNDLEPLWMPFAANCQFVVENAEIDRVFDTIGSPLREAAWCSVSLSSWPDLFRPSMPLRRAWSMEMPGTSPGMTAGVAGPEGARAQTENTRTSEAGH